MKTDAAVIVRSLRDSSLSWQPDEETKMSLQHSTNQPKSAPNPQAPVGGSIIGPDGKEIIITEEMVQQACEKLEQSRKAPAKND